jgi:tetratricopeptide (TPR) repeat protein
MDARKNNVSLPWSTYWLLFFFWLIAVPVYIFYSRKGIRKLKAFACFILYVIFLYSFPFICLYYLPSLAYYAHDSGLHKIALWLYSRDIYFYDDAWAYYNRACLYQEMGMESESEKDYKKAKKLDPSLFENE